MASKYCFACGVDHLIHAFGSSEAVACMWQQQLQIDQEASAGGDSDADVDTGKETDDSKRRKLLKCQACLGSPTACGKCEPESDGLDGDGDGGGGGAAAAGKTTIFFK